VGADHKGPLAAFVVIAIIAAVLLVTSVRSQADEGWLAVHRLFTGHHTSSIDTGVSPAGVQHPAAPTPSSSPTSGSDSAGSSPTVPAAPSTSRDAGQPGPKTSGHTSQATHDETPSTPASQPTRGVTAPGSPVTSGTPGPSGLPGPIQQAFGGPKEPFPTATDSAASPDALPPPSVTFQAPHWFFDSWTKVRWASLVHAHHHWFAQHPRFTHHGGFARFRWFAHRWSY
jgi:hypothetical protein